MATDPDPLLSIPAAAKAIGLDRTTLGKQVRSGIVRNHDGRVRLSEVLADRAANIDLGRSKRGRGEIDHPAAVLAPPAPSRALEDHDVDEDDETRGPVEVDGALMDYATARAMKESYLALLRRLEFDTKRGDLAPVAEMVAFVERMFATVRELLLGLPGKLSGDLTDEQVDRLTAEIHEALEELSSPNAFLDGTPPVDDEPSFGGDGAPAASAAEPRRVGRTVPVRRPEDQRRAR